MRRPSAIAIVIAALSVVGGAQSPRGLPRIPSPDPPERERPQQAREVFRTSVTRVEVSALVLDRDGKPVRGLTAADFELFENGVAQVVKSFTPFTYQPDLLELPYPVHKIDGTSRQPASMPASNYYTSASRVFALILDDLHVDVRRTKAARAAARRLVEQLTPSDLLFVAMTSSPESTGYFSRDRQPALEMIERFTGQRLPNKSMASVRFPGHDFDAERLDHYERLCAMIRNVSLAFRDVLGKRKTVILLTEGSSFGAGMSDMIVKMPTATSGGRANVPTGATRVMNEALAAAAAGNVAIYPLNPAGLDVPDAELIEVHGLPNYPAVLEEARQAKEMSRDLAALTGGVSLVDTNDTMGGIDRAVQDASSHYILSYEPHIPPKGTEYRGIEVKVRRPGVRVLARRGYRASVAQPPPPMKTPNSLPPQLRTLLSGVMHADGLPMIVHAVPIAGKGKTAMLAVIVEVNGNAVAAGSDRRVKIEQGVLTVDGKGKATNGVRRIFDVSLSPTQWDVLKATALRSVWAIDVSKGRHQVRVASIDTTSGRGGSVYLDVSVPDVDNLRPDPLVASRVLSLMPTVFVDERLRPWTTVMPTATRVFPAGDLLTVSVPHNGEAPATAQLLNRAGTVVWQGSGTPIASGSSVQFLVPLERVDSPVCNLAVTSSSRTGQTTIGIARD
ncbi:MAG: VWA domain-containing protein [Vicinamibacterales bacterium]